MKKAERIDIGKQCVHKMIEGGSYEYKRIC